MSNFNESVYLFTFFALALLMALEAIVPRRELQQGMIWRWTNNFSLSALTWYFSSMVSTAFVLAIAGFVEIQRIGLLLYLGAGTAVSFVTLLVVSQFLNYWVHVAFHKFPVLWRIHSVHHTDVDVDVSTSYRHHPLEPIVSLPLYAPVILLLGVPLEAALAYKFAEISLTLFSHSNIRLPERLDRVLRRIILTPDFHRVHHCSERRYTDSNYGSVVPWFDYMFGTASSRPFREHQTMQLGLEYLRTPVDSRLDKLIAAPFTPSGQ